MRGLRSDTSRARIHHPPTGLRLDRRADRDGRVPARSSISTLTRFTMREAVLFGGTSSARGVSLASGPHVMKALREAGHEASAVGTAGGVLGSGDEQRLLTSGVAPDPPREEELSMIRAGAASPLPSAA